MTTQVFNDQRYGRLTIEKPSSKEAADLFLLYSCLSSDLDAVGWTVRRPDLCRPIGHYVLPLYTVFQKKFTRFVFTITKSDVDQF